MKLRKIRKDKGLSQIQLAAMSGVSTNTLSRIENGKNFDFRSLEKICSILEVRPEEMEEYYMAFRRPRGSVTAITA